ncbi:MAG: MerR family transcriptional regulator [Rhodospirillaceae bacterium]|nr:MAG: MerR family transcriptional regulator [Rhodospirillaceae bacterium]
MRKSTQKTTAYPSGGMSIGELARLTGTKVQTIRYYEQIGLMPEPGRTEGNQRFYGGREQSRLAFIRHARELGFPLEAIRSLLDLSDHPDQPCHLADQIARKQLDAVVSRIQRLEALKVELERMIQQCGQGRVENCHVIEVLADTSHAHCLTDHRAESAPL